MSNVIQLNQESVSAYHELLTNPSKHNLPIRPLNDIFKESEKITANHILFKHADQEYNRRVPKIFFYLIMEKIYGPTVHKDENGNLGYPLEYNPQ